MLRKSVLLIVGCALLLFCSCSQSEPPGDDSSTSLSEPAPFPGEPKASVEPGIKVGEKAPAFKLKDQNGKEQSLEDLVKQGSVALVFYRSADW